MRSMKSTFKVAFYLKRNAVKSNGNVPIIGRITVNKRVSQFSTQLDVNPNDWSVSKNQVITRTKEAKFTNQALDSIKAVIFNHYHSLLIANENITAEKLKNAFLGLDEVNQTLLQLFEKHNDDMLKLVGISKSISTYKKYTLAMRRLKEFMSFKYQINDISLRDIDLLFIRNYEVFLRTKCSLSHNVTAKMIQYFKKIVTLAHNAGIIQTNPFANYQIKMEHVIRGHLSQNELEVLIKKEIPIKRLSQVRDIFVFCCFTGLSYIDVRTLRDEHIRKAFDGSLWIMTKRHKTNVPVNVRLLDIPKRILEKYKNQNSNGFVLPVLSNQKMNAYLKELADICGINKNLTFHMSRHTFATTVSLANGVPIESVSKMLGHTDIKTTQIYARITDTKLSKDMEALSHKLSSYDDVANF